MECLARRTGRSKLRGREGGEGGGRGKREERESEGEADLTVKLRAHFSGVCQSASKSWKRGRRASNGKQASLTSRRIREQARDVRVSSQIGEKRRIGGGRGT